ncbi:MAG: SpoIIE family protein phosphatase [Cyclobacteriaceae bacterium]|nr:SpoIIE family protein phosphatase [Cyclobacteriaceae bacterium]MCH8514876.1 SpoIIE family protein phosphatase [Cyclobacteriaceae bacterium]
MNFYYANLFVVLIVLALFGISSAHATPIAKQGVIDLRSFQEEQTYPLNGEWLFLPSVLANNKELRSHPNKLYLSVPQGFSDLESQIREKIHFGTYQLAIVRPKNIDELYIYHPNLRAASKLYLNGQELKTIGWVSEKKELSKGGRGKNITALKNLRQYSDTLYIDVQISDFHSWSRTGIDQGITVGTGEKIYQNRLTRSLYQAFKLGFLIFVFLYHLVLFSHRNTDYSMLYYSLMAFFISIRAFIIDDNLIHQIGLTIGFEYTVKFELAAFIVVIGIAGDYLKSLFKVEFDNILNKYYPKLIYLGAILIIFIPLKYADVLYWVLLYSSFPYAVYNLWLLKNPIERKEMGSRTILGFGILVVIFYLLTLLLNDPQLSIQNYLSEFFILFFVINAFVLGRRLSNSLRHVESLTMRLESTNANLEQLISQRTNKLDEKTRILSYKNEQLERKSRDMLDSINYARNIQKAILPTADNLDEHFEDHMLINLPRDIVSGDFLWVKEYEDSLIISSVDCTGHGVPGAFMSLIAHELLSTAVISEQLKSPDQILYYINEQIKNILKQDSGNNRDGMEMSIVNINKKEGEIAFAGARHNLYYYDQEDGMRVIKGSRAGIGGNHLIKKVVFETHKIQDKAGRKYLLFSDGYPDQLGGPKGKKFMRKKLLDICMKMVNSRFTWLKMQLLESLIQWKNLGNEDQTDDIIIFGFQLSKEKTSEIIED